MKSEEATTFWRQFFAAADRMREIGSSDYEQLLVNMTFNQLRMIKIVYLLNREFPEGVTLKVLAESLSITPAAASEMVDALVRKDMLRRDHNPQDRRAVAISLAPTSRRKFQECEQTFDRRVFRGVVTGREGGFRSDDDEVPRIHLRPLRQRRVRAYP